MRAVEGSTMGASVQNYSGAASRQLHQFAEMPAPSLADIKLTVAMSGYRHSGTAAFYNGAELLHDNLLTAVVK